MTDEQIIKALKMWLGEGDCNSECPLLEMGYCFDCACVPPEIVSGIFDLINRQMAEIENLKLELKVMRGAANSYKLELERKEDELHRAKVEISKHFDYMDSAANETIKEFAERLCEGRVENDPVVIATKAELDYVLGVGLEVQK